MKTQYIIAVLLAAILGAASTGKAQSTPGSDASFLSGDQKLVRMAVDSALCIVRQEYTLTNRSGAEYGRNGKDYFGRMLTIGVVSGNRIWADGRIFRPWESDANFEKYKAIDSIKPQLSRSSARPLTGSGYTALKEGRGGDSLIVALGAPDSTHNIPMTKDVQDKTGWLVVVSTKENPATGDTLTISYTIYKAQPQFGLTGSKGYIKNMPVKENVIGAVYFTSRIELGKILFTAAGLLGRDKTGWFVQAFPGGPVTGGTKKGEDLTPLNQINNLR